MLRGNRSDTSRRRCTFNYTGYCGCSNGHYSIPSEYKHVIYAKLKKEGLTGEQLNILHRIRKKMTPNYPTEENYEDFFSILLWMEEAEAHMMLKEFNMKSVTMNVSQYCSGYLELKVHGLAEKRPSLIVGDIVIARIINAEEAAPYKGVICDVANNTIRIKEFPKRFFEIVKKNPKTKMNVTFDHSRLVYERMHKAIRQVNSRMVFPKNTPIRNRSSRNPVTRKLFEISESNFFNSNIFENPEQRMAVTNIINATSKRAPFILFGPPGTGKTMTIVEAIIQIALIWKKSHRILVCAPSNAACDTIASRLLIYFTPDQLLRLHSESLDEKLIHPDVIGYSSILRSPYKASDLMKFKIVICTLMLAGKFDNSEYNPDYLFIDEAAQAREPEAVVPIAGLLNLGSQIILAGDPHQLGPVCLSKVAAEKGLNKSLLTRLMEMDMYKSKDTNVIIKLLHNYRSHEQIIRIPNNLFYEGELKCHPNNDSIVKYDILKDTILKTEQATVFHAVIGEENRQGNSPSYFNLDEIDVVLTYVKALLNLKNITEKVSEEDIGIISPYIGQVYKIIQRLRDLGHEKIEVGTTEIFQGKEKRVVILSVVRSRDNLLSYDQKYNLGFVEDPKRFNVAVTRAKSKLIVIGNPLCMYKERDSVKKWSKYIDQCVELNSIRGTPFKHHKVNELSNLCQWLEKARLT